MVKRVGVFWDLGNFQPNPTLTACKAANNIREMAIQHGSVTTFNAYADEALEGPKARALQALLCASGVTMIHCPHFSEKRDVGQTLAVDMMAFAFDSRDDCHHNASRHHKCISEQWVRNADVVSWEDDLETPQLQVGSSQHFELESSSEYEISVQEPGDIPVERSLSLDMEWTIGSSHIDAGAAYWPLAGSENPSVGSFWDDITPDSTQTSSPSNSPVLQPSNLPVDLAPILDERFSLLVEIFRNLKRSDSPGFSKLLSKTLRCVLEMNKRRMRQATGLSNPKKYIRLARTEGVIISPRGDKWIEMNPNLYKAEGGQPKTIPPDTTPTSLPSNDHHQRIPERYISLYWLLRELSPSSRIVNIGALGSSIKERDPGLYKRVGVRHLTSFLKQARSAGLVVLGAPEWRNSLDWVLWVGPHLPRSAAPDFYTVTT
ncbi:hypothetical protein SCHPADRAFT_941289 [Schizopora paradoxa]|uniref:NYN domain-containing protein n=1 Tax=Schizopora paradoxa TaxID=27342 RepID=A0A0H2S676_9AGAM|nr:hypothetical protein SCHPADRAFT_941289 [Schizopora paradoxa]